MSHPSRTGAALALSDTPSLHPEVPLAATCDP